MAAILTGLTIADYALKVLQAAPTIVAVTNSAGAALDQLLKGNAAIAKMQQENRQPTQEEWDALDAEIAALQKNLHS